MTVRRYLCRIIGGPPSGFSPEIVSEPMPEGSAWTMLDLRTFEDYRDLQGFGLIMVDGPDSYHAALVAAFGLAALDAGTTKGEIDAIIGSEANGERFDNPLDYLGRVHVARTDRRQRERRRR